MTEEIKKKKKHQMCSRGAGLKNKKFMVSFSSEFFVQSIFLHAGKDLSFLSLDHFPATLVIFLHY